MVPPNGSKTAQSHELQIGTNCLGPFLLTKLLTPLMNDTASASPANSVRVTWAGSLAVDAMSPSPGGMTFSGGSGGPEVLGKESDYGQSKVGNVFLASESARRYGKSGVLHLAWNPGNLRSELQRHMGVVQKVVIDWMLCYEPVMGAYTELYAGWSKDVTEALNGAYVVPWGRIGSFRTDVVQSLKGEDEGGSGKAQRFWDWCDEETKAYS